MSALSGGAARLEPKRSPCGAVISTWKTATRISIDLLRDAPSPVENDFRKKYELSWVYHENALEGVVFSGQELELALAQTPVAEASSLSTFRDVRNMKAAIDIIRAEASSRKSKINMALVKRLYEAIHTGIEARATAELRKEIPLHRAYFHDIDQPARIAGHLAKLLDWCESADFKAAHPIHKASKLQHSFMQIYPYTEGSGKIARLLANLILLQAGHLPCIIHTIDRQRYYESLKQPETSLRELMMESMANGLANAEKLLRLGIAARMRRA